MENSSLPTQEQTQIIPTSKLIIVLFSLFSISLQLLCIYQDQRTEIEIITNTSYLIINNRVAHHFSSLNRVTVGINHRCFSVLGNIQKTFQSMVTQCNGRSFHIKKHIISSTILCHCKHGFYWKNIANLHDFHSFGKCFIHIGSLCSKQPNFIYFVFVYELLRYFFSLQYIIARNKTVDSMFYFHSCHLFTIY